MKLSCFAEVRSVARCRVQLGDPSKDVYEYHLYTFLKHGDFDLEQYAISAGGNFEPACFICHSDNFLELGRQYEVALSDEPSGAPVLCLYSEMINGRTRTRLKAPAEGEHEAGYWTNVFWDLTSDKPLPLEAGKLYYLLPLDAFA